MGNAKRQIEIDRVSEILKELRKLRKYQEISVKKMTSEIPISKHTVYSMDNLKHVPNIEAVLKYANYLGYDLRLIKSEVE